MIYESFLIVIMSLLLILMAKNNVIGENYNKVIDAIYKHDMDLLDRNYVDLENYINNRVGYDVLKRYELVLFNPFAWRCKDVVDEETWEKIEPYIDK